MKFQEIFDEPGLYVGTDFKKGVCFEIDKNGFLFLVEYKDENDLLPKKTNAPIYKGLFQKTYKKVFTRQSLFK